MNRSIPISLRGDGYVSVGERIRHLRKLRGWSQSDFAGEAGIHQTTICMWEQDKHVPRLDSIQVLADTLEMTMSEFLRGTRVKRYNPLEVIHG